MEYRERIDDSLGALRAALDGRQADVWTAIPGIIQSVDLKAVTCVVQPSIQMTVIDTKGTPQSISLPILPDVPLVFPRGGDCTLTFPVKKDDECLVIFASRCIDNWWQNGGVQPPFEHRLHDLADGFAIVGPFSQATKIANISATTTQLRSNDGTYFFELDVPNKKLRVVAGSVSVEADGNANVLNVAATTVNIKGDLKVTGAVVAGSGTADQVSVQTHRHGITGSTASSTIVPTPGT
jgi:hypothetical protein